MRSSSRASHKMEENREKTTRVRVLLSAREIAAAAVMCALLLTVQYVLSFVPGVELVTALFLAFCVFFGRRCGVLTATAFSLLRCFLFGFYPNVIVLYLIYFNVFALFFGWLGERRRPVAVLVCPILLFILAAGALALALCDLPVSKLYVGRVKGAAWAMFAVMCALGVLYGALLLARKGERTREAAALAALAAFFTVCFTLLDDVLTPLFYGYTWDAALAYFFTGFLAMLPQTVCAAVSVALLFPVLARILGGVRKTTPANVGRMHQDMV